QEEMQEVMERDHAPRSRPSVSTGGLRIGVTAGTSSSPGRNAKAVFEGRVRNSAQSDEPHAATARYSLAPEVLTRKFDVTDRRVLGSGVIAARNRLSDG